MLVARKMMHRFYQKNMLCKSTMRALYDNLVGKSRMKATYQLSNIQTPSKKELEQLSESLGLHINSEDLDSYHDAIEHLLELYPTLQKYQEPSLPVKYPRTPGYKPTREENRYNAWYYKTEITGAAEGPLKGKRVLIKDCFPVAGVPMRHGSRVIKGYVPDYDPTVVTRVLDAGATIAGKAACDDFALCGLGVTSHPAPVLNPVNTDHCSGGTSSGCCVLVYTEEADMALAGDQGGSIRVPSSWVGVVGYKPSYGLVPYTGLPGIAVAIDHCGPIARTVRDCALLLEVIAGDDGGQDMRQRNIPSPNNIPRYSQLLTGDVKGMRIGLLTEGFKGCEDADFVRKAALRIQEKGAIVENISVPMHDDGRGIYTPSIFEGGYHMMIRCQGYGLGPPSYYPTSAIDNYWTNCQIRSRDLPAVAKLSALVGKYIYDNYGIHFYAKSQNLCRLLAAEYNQALERCDVFILPTTRYKAPKLPGPDFSVSDELKKSGSMGNTAYFNATGHPAITISAGLDDGLPVGMQIVGRHMEDETVLNIAYAYEKILNGTGC